MVKLSGGCEANNEFHIVDGKKKAFYSVEKSSCCCRYCCANCRQSTGMIATAGEHKSHLVEYERPLRCMPAPFCCCCNQLMTFKDGQGAYLVIAVGPNSESGRIQALVRGQKIRDPSVFMEGVDLTDEAAVAKAKEAADKK